MPHVQDAVPGGERPHGSCVLSHLSCAVLGDRQPAPVCWHPSVPFLCWERLCFVSIEGRSFRVGYLILYFSVCFYIVINMGGGRMWSVKLVQALSGSSYHLCDHCDSKHIVKKWLATLKSLGGCPGSVLCRLSRLEFYV